MRVEDEVEERRGGVVEVEVMKRVVRGLFFPKSLFSARRDLLG